MFSMLDCAIRFLLMLSASGYVFIAFCVWIELCKKKDMALLPKKLEGQKVVKIGGKARALICPICFENFAQDTCARKLTCGHLFHRNCIDPWLLWRCYKCPLCRRVPRQTVW